MVGRVEDALARRQTFELGELAVSFEPLPVIRGPRRGGSEIPVPHDLGVLHEWLRFDDRGRYRPLSGARTMRAGWRFECADDAEALEALDLAYPLAACHIRQHAAGTLRVVSLDAVLERQWGDSDRSSTSLASRAAAEAVTCGRCVRQGAWHSRRSIGDIPCPEPCSVLTTLCRAAAGWETERPDGADDDPEVPFAQFVTPGNEIREAYLAYRRPAWTAPSDTHRPPRRRSKTAAAEQDQTQQAATWR